MTTIVIRTQAEWDALPKAFDAQTRIEIRSEASLWIRVATVPTSSHVEARESSHVEAWGSSHVVARESSHVVARGSSHVVAWESSHVVAWGSSHVEARENSHVVAWESSHVVAWESSHVVARGSSHVVAWESSHVMAWGSSHVEAWGSSHVEARESVSVHVQSTYSAVDLFGFAVAILLVAATKVAQKSKTSTIVRPEPPKGTDGWLDAHAIEPAETVVLYKRVSENWKTQEDTPNETVWEPGRTLEHPAWNPTVDECGVGKFHACGRPYFCDEFRDVRGDRYVAIEIATADLHAWDTSPNYPHKIAFRKGTVLHEVDRFGERVAARETTDAG